jgi:DNA invertase Pin-like site-specific DNA recombinase
MEYKGDIRMKVGYIRVSSDDQNIDRQLVDVPVDKKFIDKLSGKNTNRPAYIEMMNFVRQGDTLIVHSLDRLARNLYDLQTIVKTLVKKGVQVQFMKESLTFTGDDSPISHLTLSIMGAFAEFERSIIRERQLEGIRLAKTKGIYKGRKRKLNSLEVEAIMKRLEYGHSKTEVAKEFNVSLRTIYSYLKETNEKTILKSNGESKNDSIQLIPVSVDNSCCQSGTQCHGSDANRYLNPRKMLR